MIIQDGGQLACYNQNPQCSSLTRRIFLRILKPLFSKFYTSFTLWYLFILYKIVKIAYRLSLITLHSAWRIPYSASHAINQRLWHYYLATVSMYHPLSVEYFFLFGYLFSLSAVSSHVFCCILR